MSCVVWVLWPVVECMLIDRSKRKCRLKYKRKRKPRPRLRRNKLRKAVIR